MRTRGEAAGVKVRGDSRQPLGVEMQEAVARTAKIRGAASPTYQL